MAEGLHEATTANWDNEVLKAQGLVMIDSGLHGAVHAE